jgi:hypothetical protein
MLFIQIHYCEICGKLINLSRTKYCNYCLNKKIKNINIFLQKIKNRTISSKL